MAGHKPFRILSAQVEARLASDPVRRERSAARRRAMKDALALGQLRERRGATQSAVAGGLGTSQPNVSRTESRMDRHGDAYLSTLSDYVEALGGRFEITAAFPDEMVQLLLPTTQPTTAAPS